VPAPRPDPYRGFDVPQAVPPARGNHRAFGGYAANVDAGALWQGTTAQICGLFPFASASGARVRGVPFGRHLHTAEPIGLDPKCGPCRSSPTTSTWRRAPRST